MPWLPDELADVFLTLWEPFAAWFTWWYQKEDGAYSPFFIDVNFSEDALEAALSEYLQSEQQILVHTASKPAKFAQRSVQPLNMLQLFFVFWQILNIARTVLY